MPTYKDMSEAEWNKLLEYASAHDAVRVLGEIVFARLAPRAVLEEMRITSPEHAPDWTAQNGVPNASPTYLECVGIVVRAIMDGAHDLLDGGVHGVARAIVSELAHKHGLIPETPSKHARALADAQLQRDMHAEALAALAKELYGGLYTGVDGLLAVVRRLKAASAAKGSCPMTLSGECKALRDVGLEGIKAYRPRDLHLGPYDAQQRERLTREAMTDMRACAELPGGLPETRERAAFILHELEALAAIREGR